MPDPTAPAPATAGRPAVPPEGPVASVPVRSRVDALDGLRGIAIVLVVLSHGWQLWPTGWIDAHELVRPLFRSGNFAVTVFLVAAGYLTYTTLAARGLPRMQPGVALVRRVLRVGPSLWLMLAAILVVSTMDSSDRTDKGDNVDSVLHVLTYTWNWYVQGNLVTSRPDFGHLWYLSVDMQAFVLMACFLYVLRRRTVGLLFALGGFLVLLTWWRFHVTDTEYVFQVLVRTTARMDPFVVGVMLGAALPLVRRLSPTRRVLAPVAVTALLLLVPLMWYCSRDERFLAWGVTLLELDLAVLLGAVALMPGAAPAPVRAVSVAPLAFLGRHSLLLYIWHYPVFVLVQRHTDDLAWPVRTAVGLAATVLVCLLSHWLVERRAAALLRHPGWAQLRDGIPAFVSARTRAAARSAGLPLPRGRR